MLKLFEWDQTVDYYLRSLHMSKKEDDHEEIAKSFRGLGIIYYLQGDYKRSMECYLKYMEFPKKERKALNILSLIEVGDIYFEMGDFNHALTYFKLAIKKGEEAELKQECESDEDNGNGNGNGGSGYHVRNRVPMFSEDDRSIPAYIRRLEDGH